MIVSASYVAAALAIYCAALYLIYRLRLYFTASSMLVGFLLLVYGPAYLAYMLFRRPISVVDLRISNTVNFDHTVVSLNVAIAMMFVCVVVGIELVDRLAPRSTRALNQALVDWNSQPLGGARKKPWLLLIVILALGQFMTWVSAREHHLAIIAGFLSAAGNEAAKTAYRQQHGGSGIYLYNVVVASIAPMLIVWAALWGWKLRWWPLLAATIFLLVLTVLGKIETLSKAPFALFLIQLLLAAYLVFRNNVSWRVVLFGVAITLIIFYPIIRLAVPEVDQMEAFTFFYYRAFDISNQALLEYFGAIPERIPFMLGDNIRPLAMLLGHPYVPSFNTVSQIWRYTAGSTTTAMFIADAWADFSYLGVIGSSLIAGMVCRGIDIVLVRGKTVTAVATIAGAFIGIYSLMISALPTSMLSGGLIMPPIIVILILEGQRRANRRYAQLTPC